jgi:hypothetical protein
MPVEQRVITAVDSAGRSYEVTARASTDTRHYRLELESPEFGTHVAEAADVFECLCQLRMQLGEDGIRLCCNGARLNVWPSGMARDMGGGFKAYALQMGRKASREDLVDIFDAAPIDTIATVKEQRRFNKEWLSSPKI